VEDGISGREWGETQARSSPPWSEEKWQRIGTIFGVDFVTDVQVDHPDRTAQADPDAA
jgi:hypothetical protein